MLCKVTEIQILTHNSILYLRISEGWLCASVYDRSESSGKNPLLGSSPTDTVSSLARMCKTPNSIFRIKTSVQKAIVTRCRVISTKDLCKTNEAQLSLRCRWCPETRRQDLMDSKKHLRIVTSLHKK